MLTAIMIFLILNTLFTMACVGHLSNVEKYMKCLAEAKVAELNIFNGEK